MSATLVTLGEDDLDRAHAARLAAFGPPSDEERALAYLRGGLAAGEVRGVVDGSELVGVTRAWAQDHWLGSRRVPCQHVASVAVPPEHRRRGVAARLVRDALQRGADDGLALSLLYPATYGLYRRLGWELAGTFRRHRVSARDAAADGPRMRRLDLSSEADRAAVHRCREVAGRLTHGTAVPRDADWQRLWPSVTHAYGLDGADGLEAYLLLIHERPADDWRYRLMAQDAAVVTARGLRAVLAFVGGHGSLATALELHGPVPHPAAMLLDGDVLEVASEWRWMARPLDLRTLVATRGFPAGLACEVTLAVDDGELAGMRGPWRLSVLDGRGELAPAPGADVRLDVRAVGPLATGYMSPAQLALAGLVTGPDDALGLLATAFASPPPVLTEFF